MISSVWHLLEIFYIIGNELESLRKAGLGKKKFVFKNKHGDHHHLKQTLGVTFQDHGQYLII